MRRPLHIALTAVVSAETTALVNAPWSEPGECLRTTCALVLPALLMAVMVDSTGAAKTVLRLSARTLDVVRLNPPRALLALVSGSSPLLIVAVAELRGSTEVLAGGGLLSGLALALVLGVWLTALTARRLRLPWGSATHLGYWLAVALCVGGAGLAWAAPAICTRTGDFVEKELSCAALAAFLFASRYLTSTAAARGRMALYAGILLFTLSVDALIPGLPLLRALSETRPRTEFPVRGRPTQFALLAALPAREGNR